MAAFLRSAPDEAVRLFCQDETRLELKLPVPRRLTGFEVKPLQVSKPLYEYYWLYAAVEPVTGESFWLDTSASD